MKEGLSKKESAFLKGLALLMMIYHHRFIDQNVWLFDPILGPRFQFLLDPEVTRIVSWFFKIALSLMTFVSGYGIFHIFKRTVAGTPGKRLAGNYVQVGKRLLPFYGRYWYAFIVWTIVTLLITSGLQIFSIEYLLNGLGLSCSLNGSWWYVLQYVEMMLLAPFMDFYLTKLGKKIDIIKWVALACLLAMIVLIPPLRAVFTEFYKISSFQISYMAIFIVGYVVARWNLFGMARTQLAKLPRIAHILICLAGTAGITFLRIKLSTFPAYCQTDFIIAPIWILFVCELLSYVKPVLSFLGWFSKYPMYIWVMHLIFFDPFFYPITTWSGYAIGNYLTIVALTIVSSIILERLEHLVVHLLLPHIFKKSSQEKR
ncbi:MAG: hypothetical protein KBS85_03715 [Lachnospiraceae bacterium]|nr:hypothetical protein [Candidatus Merdinaster equi]